MATSLCLRYFSAYHLSRDECLESVSDLSGYQTIAFLLFYRPSFMKRVSLCPGILVINHQVLASTRLPQSRAGGQGQCWRRSLEHLGSSIRLNKSSKDCTWSAVPDALPGVIAEEVE